MGAGGRNLSKPEVENRLVSFIYLIEDNKRILLSAKFIFWWPYKYKLHCSFN